MRKSESSELLRCSYCIASISFQLPWYAMTPDKILVAGLVVVIYLYNIVAGRQLIFY